MTIRARPIITKDIIAIQIMGGFDSYQIYKKSMNKNYLFTEE
jgi:hypothetical protein